MSRVQLALNVSNLESAIEFYSKLFGVGPAKVREGYANFAIAEPPLKLVLIEGDGAPGTMNHLGVEVESTDAVAQATQRLSNKGLETKLEEETTCCFAVQDKVWVNGPDGEPWEVYTVLSDANVMKLIPVAGSDPGSVCCQ
ncbi:MAG: ArsI/CadI family heavy metal resistance metalloenzyme [Ilumatobacteraceae bacterium]|jgi:catechol 2,3-dioxygenase-like lactoylglutathione lyase family enzyme